MKPFHYLSCLILLAVLFSCSGTKTTVSESGDKTSLDQLVEQQKFRVESDWANPTVSTAMMNISGILGPQNNVQRISLIGNSNYLEINGNSVKAFLPYFGERHMGGGYNIDGEAIQFDKEVDDMNVEYLKSKKLYRITFKTKSGAESFDITLEIFASKKTTLVVNSSQRSSIRYFGSVVSLPEE